jgi:adenylosuccinate lyase
LLKELDQLQSILKRRLCATKTPPVSAAAMRPCRAHLLGLKFALWFDEMQRNRLRLLRRWTPSASV